MDAILTLSQIESARWLAVLMDATIKGLLLLAFAAVTTMLLRRSSAAMRHMIWTFAVIGLLLMPVLSATLPQWRIAFLPDWTQQAQQTPAPQQSPPAVATPNTFETAPIVNSSAARPMPLADYEEPAIAPPQETIPQQAPAVAAAVAKPQAALHWSVWVLLIWAGGVVLMAGALLPGTILVWHMRRRAGAVMDNDWQTLLADLSAKLGVRRVVSLRRIAGANIPMTCGILKPTILLPAGADDWSIQRRTVVLLHELAHIKRADCLTQLIARLARVIYWFNPLVWLSERMLRVEREQACDDLVLAAGYKASDYASHLLEIVRTLASTRWTPIAAVAMARRSQFEGRMLAILDADRNRRALTRWGVLAAVILLAVVAVPIACLKPSQPAQPKPAEVTTKPTTQPTAITPTSQPATQAATSQAGTSRPSEVRILAGPQRDDRKPGILYGGNVVDITIENRPGSAGPARYLRTIVKSDGMLDLTEFQQPIPASDQTIEDVQKTLASLYGGNVTIKVSGSGGWSATQPAPPGAKPKITLGKDTTRLTQPLRPDGLVDYPAAINQQAAKGVTHDNNAAVALLEVFGPDTISDSQTVRQETLKLLGVTYQPGQAFLACRPPEDVSSDEFYKIEFGDWKSQDHLSVAKWLKDNDAQLSALATACNRPRYFMPLVQVPGNWVSFFSLNYHVYRQAQRMLIIRANQAIGEGRPQDAWNDIQTAMKLGALLGQGDMLIGQLVAMAISSGADKAAWRLAASGQLSGAQARTMLAEASAIPAPGLGQISDTTERYEALNFIALLSSMPPEKMAEYIAWVVKPYPTYAQRMTPETVVALLDAAGDVDWNDLLRRANRYYDRINEALAADPDQRAKLFEAMDAEYKTISERAEKPPTETTAKARAQWIGDWISHNPFQERNVATIKRSQELAEEAMVSRRLSVVALALEAKKADMGRYPGTLAELSPTYLKELPKDLRDGKDFIYKPTADGSGYLLYSAGINGIDDGGTDKAHNGDDIVVQVPLPTTTKPASAPATPTSQPAGMVVKDYGIGDLLATFEDDKAKEYWSDASVSESDERKLRHDQLAQKLIDTIKSKVAADSWTPKGTGDMRIKDDLLIVQQTPENHAKIVEVLDLLRRGRQLQVVTEIRVIGHSAGTGDDSQDADILKWLAENTGVRLDGLKNPGSPLGSSTGWGPTSPPAFAPFLDDTQVAALLKYAQDRKFSVLAAPRLMAFSGQHANITAGNQQEIMLPRLDKLDDQKANMRLFTGSAVDLCATITADRKYVTVDVSPYVTELVSNVQGQNPVIAVASAKMILTMPPERTLLIRVPMVKTEAIGVKAVADSAGKTSLQVQSRPADVLEKPKRFVYFLIRPKIYDPAKKDDPATKSATSQLSPSTSASVDSVAAWEAKVGQSVTLEGDVFRDKTGIVYWRPIDDTYPYRIGLGHALPDLKDVQQLPVRVTGTLYLHKRTVTQADVEQYKRDMAENKKQMTAWNPEVGQIIRDYYIPDAVVTVIQAASQPASAPVGSKLEFRIAPNRTSPGQSQTIDKTELDTAMAQLEKGLVGKWWEGDRVSGTAGRIIPYIWLPVRGQAEDFRQYIIGQYKGTTYILLSDKPGEIMTPDGWGIVSAQAENDQYNRPAIGFRFDDKGGDLFYELTKAHLLNSLAIVVDGVVFSAPTIQSTIRDGGIITGSFTREETQKIAAALQAGMSPSKAAGLLARLVSTQPAQQQLRQISGMVVGPDGRGIEGATVFPALAGQGTSIKNGIESSGDRVTTTKDGKFSLSVPTDDWELFISHDSGYAYVLPEDLAKSDRIELRKWAVISGKAYNSTSQPAAEVQVLGNATPSDSSKIKQSIYIMQREGATTGLDGSFRIDHVIDGTVSIGMGLEDAEKVEPPGHPAMLMRLFRAESGKVSEVVIGGRGRTVTAKFVLPDGMSMDKITFSSMASLGRHHQTKEPAQCEVLRKENKDKEARDIFSQWLTTPEGKKYLQEGITYMGKIADGGVSFLGVEPGKYTLYTRLNVLDSQGTEEPKAMVWKDVEIPAGDEPLDLGEIKLGPPGSPEASPPEATSQPDTQPATATTSAPAGGR